MKDWIFRLIHMDPALIRGVIVAFFVLIGSFGAIINSNQQVAIIGFVFAALAMFQALWTRTAVTPNAKVAVVVPDPINAPNVVAAGSAITNAPSAKIVEAARTGDTNGT